MTARSAPAGVRDFGLQRSLLAGCVGEMLTRRFIEELPELAARREDLAMPVAGRPLPMDTGLAP